MKKIKNNQLNERQVDERAFDSRPKKWQLKSCDHTKTAKNKR